MFNKKNDFLNGLLGIPSLLVGSVHFDSATTFHARSRLGPGIVGTLAVKEGTPVDECTISFTFQTAANLLRTATLRWSRPSNSQTWQFPDQIATSANGIQVSYLDLHSIDYLEAASGPPDLSPEHLPDCTLQFVFRGYDDGKRTVMFDDHGKRVYRAPVVSTVPWKRTLILVLFLLVALVSLWAVVAGTRSYHLQAKNGGRNTHERQHK